MSYFSFCCSDPPGPPSRPEITDYDKNHVDLKWDPPKNDGGAPILKYIVEKKPKFGDWEKASSCLLVHIILPYDLRPFC